MGFWSWLFGKKKNKKYDVEEDDGQAQYFKSDFDEPVKKSAPKAKKVENVTLEKSVKEPAPIKQVVEKKAAPKKAAPKKATVKKEAEVKVSPAPQAADASDRKTGKFEIKKAKDGRFVFNLYAPNHIIVATSQVYSSSSAAVNGIQSIIANAEKAPIEDNTLKNPTKQAFPKWEMYIDKGGEYRFRLYATNGNCVVHSQGYKQKSSCKNGIESIIRCSKNPEIDKSYLKKD